MSGPVELRLRVRFDSDWHVGTGAGRPGEIDRVIVRDSSGLPVVPAKTLTGIWRDACEIVATGLDDSRGDSSSGWTAWLALLFGDQVPTGGGQDAGRGAPRPARLSVSRASCSERLVAALPGAAPAREALLEAAGMVKPGVALDPALGTARHGELRFVEYARGGVTLVARAELAVDGLDASGRAAAVALLAAGAGMVERIGGRRRRGAGRCRVVLEGDQVPSGGRLLSELGQPCPVVAGDAVAPTPEGAETQDPPATGSWRRVELALTLGDPVLVGGERRGNAVIGLDRVPGSFLLPAVVRYLARRGAADLERLWAAARSGTFVACDATIEVSGQRGLPAPLTFATDKSAELDPGNRQVHNLLSSGPAPSVATASMGGRYLALCGEEGGRPVIAVSAPERETTTRGSIDDLSQRPGDAERGGGVYTYRALARGTRLRAELMVDDAATGALAGDWWSKLDGAGLRLGASKKDDYGRVAVEVLGGPATVPAEAPPQPRAGLLDVWLLSDLLARDGAQRPIATLSELARVLGKALGARLELEQRESDGRPLGAARAVRLESWQGSWGLPRPSLVGLAAGTSARFMVADGAVDPAALRALELSGLGERRGEGFGRLAFDDPLLSALPLLRDGEVTERFGAGEPDAPAPLPEPRLLASNDAEAEYAMTLERAAWRAAIDRGAELVAADPEGRQRVIGRLGSRPSPSQLGVIRSRVGRVRELEDAGALSKWLKELTDAGESRGGGWSEATAPLVELLEQPGAVWALLADGQTAGVPADAGLDRLVLTEGGSERLRAELWPEALRALLDARLRAEREGVVREAP